MKRKLLLFSLLLALMAPWTANAQTTVEIGDGTGTTYYFPIDNYFNYSCTEQIYTAEEIGTAGNITAVSFYYNYGTAYTASNVTMYMKNVDRSNFSATTDCEALALGDIVWTGSIAPTEAGWYTFVLDTPFEYDGTSNLLVAFFDGTSGYPGTAYTWRQTTSPNNAYMALRYYSDGTCPDPYNLSSYSGSKQYYTYRSNIQIEITPAGGPTCARPDEFTAGNVTSTSALLSWTGGEGTYNVEYKKASDQEWTPALTNSTLTQIELSNLEPATNYQARVQSACGTDPETGDPFNSGWKNVSFRTECEVIATFPWIMDFENMDANIVPNCWDNSASTSTTASSTPYYVWGSYTYNNNKMLRMYNYFVQSGTALINTPTIELPNEVYQLTFDYSNRANCGAFSVKISEDGGTTFTELQSFAQGTSTSSTDPGTFTEATISLADYAGKSVILQFYATANYGSGAIFVDNIIIDTPPTCPKPTSLAYSDVTGHTANLTWTPGAEGQTQWQICLNGDEDNLILVNSAEGAYTLTGLSGQTPYTAKVRAYCGETDQSYWSNQVSFTTTVTCITPTGLTNSNVTNHSATLNWTSDATEWILAYKLYSAHDSTYIEVPVTEKPYILDGLTPETRYMVRVRANCGEEDGLSTWSYTTNFTTLEAYPAPGNLTCDSTFAYSAYFSWDELGTATDWEVEYKLATDTAYTMSELTPDNHPFMLGGLEPLLPGTDYVIRVRSIYFTEQGDTASAWSNEVPFTTLLTCPAPTELTVIDSTINAYGATLTWEAIYSDSYNVAVIPYEVVIETMVNTGFEDNEIPSAFTNSTSYPWTVTEGGANGSSYCAIPGNIGVNSSSSDLTFVVTGPASVSFNAKVSSESGWDYGRFLVDGSQRMQISGTQDWTAYSYELTEGEHTLVWRYYKDSSGASGNDLFYVDDIVIAGSSIVMLEGSNYPAEEATITLNALQPETHYMVSVTSFCGEETSEVSETVSFLTLPSCLAPTELAVANESVTAHAATLSWTENGSATEWVIEYTAVVNDTTVTNTINVTENPYTLTGLLAETPYAVKVQAYCSTTDQSDWSNTVHFGTPVACPAPTALAVDEESITTEGATISWEGNSESYVVMIGEPDPENVIDVETTFVDADFEDQVIPTTWNNDATYPWVITDASANEGTYSIKSGNYNVGSSTSSIQITIEFEAEATISFAARCSSEQTSQTSDWDYGTFYIDGLQQGDKFINSTTFESRSYNVEAGSHTFMWRYKKDGSVNSYDDCFYVDNIVITGTATMAVPSSWTEIPVEESPYTFEGLTPGTTYFVQVESVCEGEQSHVSEMISFTTTATCVVPTDFAATEVTAHTATLVWNGENDSYVVNYRVAAGTQDWINVDFENGLPDGWTNEGASSWSVGTGDYTTTTGAHSGTYNAKINHGTTGDVTYLVSPAIDLSEQSDLTLKLWYINRSWAGDTDGFGIYYRIDGGAWNEIFSTTSAHSSWTEFNQALPAGAYAANCQFGFKFTDEYGYGVGLDDINISIPTPAGEWMTATANENTVVLSGLVGETTYEAMVQAVCSGDDSSEFTDIITFTTEVACPAVTELAADTVGTHEAVISWVETGAATAWQICLNGDEDNLIEVVANTENDTITYTLEGLAQDADITVKVRANCGDEDGTSIWTSISFHTLVACERPSNLAVENIGTESATLMWEGESESYVVQYRPWEQVGEDVTTDDVMTTYTFDLSEYSGNGSIAIRHYNVWDQFWLIVDDIVLTNAQGETVFSENFESGSTYPTMDMDGDGHDWLLMGTSLNVNGNYGYASESYDNDIYVALYPDNWLIISGVELGGQLTLAARGQEAGFAAEVFGVFVSPENGFVEEIVEDTQIDLWDLTPSTTYAWQVKGICGEDESQWVASSFTTMEDYLTFVTDGDWNDANNWDPAQVPTTDNNVHIQANAIIPAGVVAEANKVTIVGGSITIKEGGQMKLNSQANVTMEKEIVGYGEGNGNYYLLASPLTSYTVFVTSQASHVDSLIYNAYDLYTFDRTYGVDEEWVNYKAHPEHINFQSASGNFVGLLENEGYLYANQVGSTLLFTGSIKKNIGNTVTKTVAYDSINRGWALVGNNFACNAYLTVFDGEDDMLEANYYVMNAAGDDFELAETANGIAPMTAAFVNFGTTGAKIQISSEEPNTSKYGRTGKFVMSLNQEGNTVDKAVLRFGKGMGLEKMSLKNNSKLYFSNNDKDYAVVYTMRQGEMPVNFKAETAGSYTISFAADGVSFKELVLVDNVNETKVDLLANPSYTFETEAGEFAGRFTIVYRVK